jgi:hypothetical protein
MEPETWTAYLLKRRRPQWVGFVKATSQQEAMALSLEKFEIRECEKFRLTVLRGVGA